MSDHHELRVCRADGRSFLVHVMLVSDAGAQLEPVHLTGREAVIFGAAMIHAGCTALPAELISPEILDYAAFLHEILSKTDGIAPPADGA